MNRKRLCMILFFSGIILFFPVISMAVVSADFEDNSVTYSGGQGSIGTHHVESNSPVNYKNGSRSLQLHYKLTNTVPHWLYLRGTFAPARDWRNSTSVRFWLKGDGSTNFISFKFACGLNEFDPAGSEAITLVSTNWRKVEIPLGSLTLSGAGVQASQAQLASVTSFLISLNGNDTGVFRDIFIDDIELVDTRPQVFDFDNVNMDIYSLLGIGSDIIMLTNSESVFQQGTGSLRITYAPLDNWALAQVSLYTQDWSTNGGVSFYLRGDGNADATFNFEISASGNNFNRDQIPLTGTSWRKITLRFSDLSSSGPPPTANDLKKVSAIRFILNESPAPGTTTGVLYLDDFQLLGRPDSAYIDDYENLFAAYSFYGNPGVLSASNLPDDFHGGAQSLKINYNLNLGVWGGLRRNFNPTNDFQQGNALSFWVRGDGSTNILKVQIGTPDVTSPAGGYYWRYFIPLNDTSWHRVWIPFKEFTDNTPKAPSLSGLSKVSNYWLFVEGSGGTGTVRVDDMRLITIGTTYTPWEWIMKKQSGVSYLIDSYDDANNSGWIYDQTLACMALVLKGSNERARWLLKTLQHRQEANGSFVTVYDPYTGKPDNGTPHVTGNNSWVIMAVNYYTYKTGDTQFLPMASACANRLLNYQGSDGCFSMGPEKPAIYSTENNIDCFSAFYYLSVLTGNTAFREAALKVLGWLQSSAWDNFAGYFYQGKNDPWLALDPNSFGILAFGPTGPQGADYARSLAVCSNNLRLTDQGCQGFTFDQSTVASPGCVWLEGTTSMAMAYHFAGRTNTARFFFTQVSNRMRADGGLAYTTRGDTSGDVQTNSGMATAAWVVFFDHSPKLNPLMLFPTNLPYTGGLPSTYGRLPVIDDFEDGLLIKNNLGLANGHSDNVTNELITNSPAGGRQALKIKYDTTAAWAAWWTTISRDISAYKELSFAVKGEKGGNQFSVVFNDSQGAFKSIASGELLPFGVSGEWQTVLVPLRKFLDFRKLDFRSITTLDFVFSGKDTLYLDDIVLIPALSVMDKPFGEGSALARLVLDRNIFSPNADGLDDTVSFTLEMKSPGEMSLEIFNLRGGLVRRMSQNGLSAEFIWDGRDKDGRLLNNGLYVYMITARDSSGRTEKVRKLILLEK